MIRIATWLDFNFEKIWVGLIITSVLLVIIGAILRSNFLFDLGDDIAWFYDECLCE